MRKKRPIEDEINDMMEEYGARHICGLIREIYEFYELYDVDENDDWIEKQVGAENAREVRIIRTCYLLSRMAELHAGMLIGIRTKYPMLYKRLHKHIEEQGAQYT